MSGDGDNRQTVVALSIVWNAACLPVILIPRAAGIFPLAVLLFPGGPGLG